MGKAMYEETICSTVSMRLMSLHDQPADADGNIYFPTEIFSGYSNQRLTFIKEALQAGRHADTVVLSHINLLMVAWMIKKISPKTNILLFAHGIEIWGGLENTKKRMLPCVDRFICVSNFTKATIQKEHGIAAQKCFVLNNCLDPFLAQPEQKIKSDRLLMRYGYQPTDTVLFTLTRLSSKDRYKGYDRVMEALALIKNQQPGIRYLVGGGYDTIELEFVYAAIRRLGLQDTVTIAGYIPDEELADHFTMADIYVMPSSKEGFGIVFIEAMYYGLPVIAGNADGSVDALLNGELGLLVHPDSVTEIKTAIEKMMMDKNAYQPNRELLMQHFSYDHYKDRLRNAIMKKSIAAPTFL